MTKKKRQPRLRPDRRRTAHGTIHRAILGVTAAALAISGAVIPPSLAVAASEDESGFDIPAAALTRPLGGVVEGSCVSLRVPTCDERFAAFLPFNTPGLGVPLGGIGAGSFMVNQSGTFGPWHFGGSQNTSYEVRALSQAAFHVREQVGTQLSRTKTLATDGPDVASDRLPGIRSWEDPLPAWDALEPGDAEYAALYPFGWMSYAEDVFSTDVSLRFYSPIVAGEEERTSLPVAYFDILLENNTDDHADVSAMFTMPNVGAHIGRQPATVREGLTSQYQEDGSIRSVTLSSDSEANSPDAVASEWTIAADLAEGQEFSYVTSWDSNGDGADVYSQFVDDGVLDDDAIDTSSSAGAIAVSAQLEPGESVTIPFALAWDFPQVAYADNNTVWMRRYTEFYGAQTDDRNNYVAGTYPFHQSFTIAADALRGRDEALRDVLAWWEPLVNSDEIPADIAGAAMNHLANVTFHTGVWENGLVHNSVPVTGGGERIGSAIPGTHGYFGTDSNAGGVSTLGQGGEIGIYSYSVYSDLFPFIERDRMRAKVEQILVSEDGDPLDFGVVKSSDPAVYSIEGNPFITWTPHNQSSNNPAPGAGLDPAPGTMSFLDRPANNIFRMYDYANRNDDAEFLAFAFPAMERALEFLQKTIPDDVELPEPTSQSNPQPGNVQQMANLYNAMPTDRFDSYTSGLYLLALESMIASAELVGEDPAKVDGWRADLDAASAAFETVFWNEAEGYYRYTLPQAGADEVMINTLLPQFLAERAGLPDIVDSDRYRRHLMSMYPLVASDVGPRLVGIPATADDYPFESQRVYEPNVLPGAAYSAAANYVSAGDRFDDARLMEMGAQLAQSTIDQIWLTPAHGYEFNTPYLYSSADPSQWIYPSFENNLSVWQIVDAIVGEREWSDLDPEVPSDSDSASDGDSGTGGGSSASADSGGPGDSASASDGASSAHGTGTGGGLAEDPLPATGGQVSVGLIGLGALAVGLGLMFVLRHRTRIKN